MSYLTPPYSNYKGCWAPNSKGRTILYEPPSPIQPRSLLLSLDHCQDSRTKNRVRNSLPGSPGILEPTNRRSAALGGDRKNRPPSSSRGPSGHHAASAATIGSNRDRNYDLVPISSGTWMMMSLPVSGGSRSPMHGPICPPAPRKAPRPK